MSSAFASDVLAYGGIVLEIGLLAYVIVSGRAKLLWEVVFYLAVSLGVTGARYCTLHQYGVASSEYGNFYWATDLLLVLAAFVLVVSFFRRACAGKPEMWGYVRMLLGAVLVAIAAISYFSLASHNNSFFSYFSVEFSQNLYFASLVLTTLLYLMTLKMDIADERLGMLVCGLGIEFAGPAAGLALFYLARGAAFSHLVGDYIFPLCDIGMILTWFYAITRVSSGVKAFRGMGEQAHAFVEGTFSPS